MAEKVCFVVAPIGESESDTRKRSDQVLKHIIKPSVNERGYEAQRADEISDPGIITAQVIQKLIEVPLVVADLTGWNPNVFYELAIRHAFGKPVIQLIQKGESIPFDVAAMRTIQLDHKDLDSVEDAKAEIIRQIDSIEAGAKSENPVSMTVDLQSLRGSGDPHQEGLADVLLAISESWGDVGRRIGNLEDVVGQLVNATQFGAMYAALGATTPADVQHSVLTGKNPFATLRPPIGLLPHTWNVKSPITDVTPGTPLPGTQSESS
jgi:hypothetical protein